MRLLEMDPEHLVLLLTVLALMALHAAWMVRRVHSAGVVALCRKARHAAVWVHSAVLRGAGGERDDVVETRMRARKVDHCAKVGQTLWLFLFVLSGTGVKRSLEAGAEARRDNTFSFWQDAVTVALYACLKFMQLRPGTVREATADVYYSVIMATMVLLIAPVTNTGRESLLRGVYFVNTVRCPLGMMLRPLPLVLLWDVLLVGTLAASSIVHGPPLLHNRDWGVSVALQAGICFFYIIAAKVLEGCYRAELRAAIDAQAAKEVHSAAQALLRSFCDAVVEVDSQGCIVYDTGLSSFLLRGTTLQGAKLHALMSNERDQLVVAEKLQGCEPVASLFADSIHIRMRDGTGNVLRMELFWYPFKSLSGKIHCLVGLRESSDTTQGVVPPPRRSPGVQPAPTTVGAGFESEQAASESEASADPAEGPEEAEAGVDSFGGQEVAVAVHIGGEGLPIVASSPQFAMHVGRAADDYLLKYIEDEDAFVLWIQQAANSYAYDCTDAAAAGPRHTCTVMLLTQHGRRMARCSLVMQSDEGQDDGLPTAGLCFSHFRRSNGQPLHEGSLGSSSSGQRRRRRASRDAAAQKRTPPGDSGSLASLRDPARLAL